MVPRIFSMFFHCFVHYRIFKFLTIFVPSYNVIRTILKSNFIWEIWRWRTIQVDPCSKSLNGHKPQAKQRNGPVENHVRKTAKDGGKKRVRAKSPPQTRSNGRPLTFCDGIFWNSLIFIESIVVRPARFIGITKTKRPRRASATFRDITLTWQCYESSMKLKWQFLEPNSLIRSNSFVRERRLHTIGHKRKFSWRCRFICVMSFYKLLFLQT